MSKFFEASGSAPYYGLIGNPCRLSLSPLLHRLLGAAFNEECDYLLAEPGPDSLKAVLEECRESGSKGINVTVPYKESICPYLDRIEPMAQAVGAVNTVSFTPEGTKGDNTDVYGFLEALHELKQEPAGKYVLVLGAGGAARAVLYALLSEGASVRLWNRDHARARKLAEAYLPYGGDILPVMADEIPSLDYDWIVSTLPQKAENGVLTALKLFNSKIPELVFSLAYSARISPFKAICREKSVPYSDGLAMLFYQGLRSREIWTGQHLAPELIPPLLKAFETKAKQKLVLVGFMASGKSCLGKAAADCLGKDFFDLDTYIEEKCGCSIASLFEKNGEECFRAMETEALRELLQLDIACVIACGGGSLVLPENRQLIQDSNSLIIWLDCSARARHRRLRFSQKRPLARGRRAEDIDRLYESRLSQYESSSDLRLMTDGPIKKNLKELIKLWKQSLS